MGLSDLKKQYYIDEISRFTNLVNEIYLEIKNSPLTSTYKGSIIGLEYHTYFAKMKTKNFTLSQLQNLLKGL